MSVSVDAGNSDMAIAFEGGGKFTDRLNQLADAAAEYNAALAKLQEGQAIKLSLEQADELTAKSRAEAEERIADAKGGAEKIIRDAHSATDAEREQVMGECRAAKREIAEQRAAHDVYVSGARAEVNRLLAQTKADRAAAATALAETAAVREQIVGLQQAAAQAKADADAARISYEAAHTRLMTAVSDAAALANEGRG